MTYIRLKFQSPRPESFAIFKRNTEDSEWVPYQYYSTYCKGFYKVNDDRDKYYLTRHNETRAQCTSEFSDISPVSGANIVFTTLEGRPSANNFEDSPEIQVILLCCSPLQTLLTPYSDFRTLLPQPSFLFNWTK